MAELTALIVEDNILASAALVRLLSAHHDMGAIRVAETLASSRQHLNEMQFSVVLVDVGLPDGSGVALGDELCHRHPASALVYLTADPSGAVRAFSQGAVDYLLKPIIAADLARAMGRVRQRRVGARPSVLEFRDGPTTRFVPIDKISAVESAGHYQCVHANGEVHLIREPIAALMCRLGAGFVRVHRSIVVRADLVEVVRSFRNGDGELVLQGGKAVRFSRSYRKEVEAAMARR